MVRRIVVRTMEQGGATFDVGTQAFLEPDNYWYFPKHPARTRIVDQARLAAELTSFIERNLDVCRQADVWLGTWLNPVSGKCYLDITTRLADKAEALSYARLVGEVEARKIVTIYNPELDQTVYV